MNTDAESRRRAGRGAAVNSRAITHLMENSDSGDTDGYVTGELDDDPIESDHETPPPVTSSAANLILPSRVDIRPDSKEARPEPLVVPPPPVVGPAVLPPPPGQMGGTSNKRPRSSGSKSSPESVQLSKFAKLFEASQEAMRQEMAAIRDLATRAALSNSSSSSSMSICERTEAVPVPVPSIPVVSVSNTSNQIGTLESLNGKSNNILDPSSSISISISRPPNRVEPTHYSHTADPEAWLKDFRHVNETAMLAARVGTFLPLTWYIRSYENNYNKSSSGDKTSTSQSSSSSSNEGGSKKSKPYEPPRFASWDQVHDAFCTWSILLSEGRGAEIWATLGMMWTKLSFFARKFPWAFVLLSLERVRLDALAPQVDDLDSLRSMPKVKDIRLDVAMFVYTQREFFYLESEGKNSDPIEFADLCGVSGSIFVTREGISSRMAA